MGAVQSSSKSLFSGLFPPRSDQDAIPEDVPPKTKPSRHLRNRGRFLLARDSCSLSVRFPSSLSGVNAISPLRPGLRPSKMLRPHLNFLHEWLHRPPSNRGKIVHPADGIQYLRFQLKHAIRSCSSVPGTAGCSIHGCDGGVGAEMVRWPSNSVVGIDNDPPTGAKRVGSGRNGQLAREQNRRIAWMVDSDVGRLASLQRSAVLCAELVNQA